MIVVVEELVDEAVIRADPNRTIIPGLIVDAVVVEPWGAHPSVRPGRLRPGQPLLPRLGPDHARRGRRPRRGCASGSYDLDGRAAYVEKLGAERVATLRPSARRPPGRVDYGAYR